MLKVYFLDIIDMPDVDINNLPGNTIEFVEKYNQQKAKNLSGYSWIFLKEILNKEYEINLEKKLIKHGKNGKPYIEGIFFNISHSNNLIAIAIGDKEVGIDIESESNIKKHLNSKYFLEWLNGAEILKFNNAENSLEFLTKLWTKKEALLKQKGIGIKNLQDFKNVKGKVITYTLKDKNGEKYAVSWGIY